MIAIRILTCGLVLTSAAACSQTDPYLREGMWQPEGTNSRNLAAMAANPAELMHGGGAGRPQSQLATAAVQRLLAGQPAPLPSINADAAPGAVAPTAAAPALAPAAAAPAAAAGTN